MIGILIQGTMIDQDTNCRQVGRCVHGPVLDGEIDDMIPRHGELDPEAAAREFEEGISEHIEAGVRRIARMAVESKDDRN